MTATAARHGFGRPIIYLMPGGQNRAQQGGLQ